MWPGNDFGNAECVILLLDELADFVILVQHFGEVFFVRVPLRVPTGDDADSQAVRIDFLTHLSDLLDRVEHDGDVARALVDAVRSALADRLHPPPPAG